MSVQLFSISISTRRIFLGDSEQVIDISNIVIHRKNGLLVNVSPLGAARESARSLFNLMAEPVAGFVPRACFEVAGYLWLDVLEVDINVGYCKHLTVRISIRRQLRLQPLESEEGQVATPLSSFLLFSIGAQRHVGVGAMRFCSCSRQCKRMDGCINGDVRRGGGSMQK